GQTGLACMTHVRRYTLSTDSQIEQQNTEDPFENVLYRTEQSERETKVVFVSQTFYGSFATKMEADYFCRIDLDRISFVTKYTTHVRGLRCDISMDSHFHDVTVTGVGHKLWRDHSFPVTARSLFKRFVKHVDEHSQLVEENPSQHNILAVQDVSTYTVDPLLTSTPLVPKPGIASHAAPAQGWKSHETEMLSKLVEKNYPDGE
ncbi:MAG: hypothetical protein ABW185_22240, partial [Sedimenticola sp.]